MSWVLQMWLPFLTRVTPGIQANIEVKKTGGGEAAEVREGGMGEGERG